MEFALKIAFNNAPNRQGRGTMGAAVVYHAWTTRGITPYGELFTQASCTDRLSHWQYFGLQDWIPVIA
jgi:hypothetical protein